MIGVLEDRIRHTIEKLADPGMGASLQLFLGPYRKHRALYSIAIRSAMRKALAISWVTTRTVI